MKSNWERVSEKKYMVQSMKEQYFTYMFKSFFNSAVCSEAVGLYLFKGKGPFGEFW